MNVVDCNLQDLITNIKNQMYIPKSGKQRGGGIRKQKSKKKIKKRKNNVKSKINNLWWLRRRCVI